MAVVVTGGSPYQTGASVQNVVASGGRTLTFAAGANTITASSGDFTTEFSVGQLVAISGTTSNNGLSGTISGLTATVMTVAAALVNEGPLSATARVDGFSTARILAGAELQNGRYGHYIQISQGPGFPSLLTILFDSGPGLPTGFSEWGAGGISIECKVGKHDAWPAPGGITETFTLALLDPADGTTVLASATRAVTAIDADYDQTLAIDKATLDALGLQAGDEIRLKLTVQESGVGGSGPGDDMFPFIRFGKLTVDDGSGGGGGGSGGGGGGTGDVTGVTASDPLETTSSTGPVPNTRFKTQSTGNQVLATLDGAPGFPSFRSLVADDLPSLAALYVAASRTINTTSPIQGGGDLSADRTFHLGTPSTNTVLKGTGGDPAFGALVAADMPAGTVNTSWQLGSGAKIQDNGDILESRTSAGALAKHRAADPTGATDVVTKGYLDAFELTIGYGVNLLYSECHEESAGPQTSSYNLPADTLQVGGTGVEIIVAGVAGAASATDQLQVSFGGTDLVFDAAGGNITYPSGTHVNLRIRLMTPVVSPGSGVVTVEVFGDTNTNTRVRPTYKAFTTSNAQTIAVGWTNSDGAIQVFSVALLGGIPENPIEGDGDTPRVPQPSSGSLPTAVIVKRRTGTGPSLHRLSGGATVSGSLDGDISSTVESGTMTGLVAARFNDWIKFGGASFCLLTLGVASHRVYTRPIGGPVNTTAVDIQAAAVSFSLRTGLHVTATEDGPVLWYLYQVTNTFAVNLVTTRDGATWTTTTVTPSQVSSLMTAFCAYGVAQLNGVAFVPACYNLATFAGFAVNPAAATVTAIMIPGWPTFTRPCFAVLYERVFAMSGATNSSVQRTIYEVQGGTGVALIALTNSGGDTTPASSVSAVCGCLVATADNTLLAIYPTNTGAGAAAVAFFRAAEITFASASDTAPAETARTSFPPSAMTTAGAAGVTTTTSGMSIFATVDNESDPGNGQIYFFWAAGISGAYVMAKYADAATTLSGTTTGADPTNYAIVAGDPGGGQRFSADDSADVIWETASIVPLSGVGGGATFSFQFEAQGSDTWTLKIFVKATSNGGILTMAQATLMGTATGGTATRVASEVNGCESGTLHTIGIDLGTMGLDSNVHLELMPKIYREP